MPQPGVLALGVAAGRLLRRGKRLFAREIAGQPNRAISRTPTAFIAGRSGESPRASSARASSTAPCSIMACEAARRSRRKALARRQQDDGRGIGPRRPPSAAAAIRDERRAGRARHLIGADQALRVAGAETLRALGIELGQRRAELPRRRAAHGAPRASARPPPAPAAPRPSPSSSARQIKPGAADQHRQAPGCPRARRSRPAPGCASARPSSFRRRRSTP